jgi:hypothetical protein
VVESVDDSIVVVFVVLLLVLGVPSSFTDCGVVVVVLLLLLLLVVFRKVECVIAAIRHNNLTLAKHPYTAVDSIPKGLQK